MRLVINLGESRKIRFSADQVDMSEVARGSEDNSEIAKSKYNQGKRRYPGLGFEIVTISGFSAYLMSSHGNGGCFLSYTDESKKVAIQAQPQSRRLVRTKVVAEPLFATSWSRI